ncbi:hypothetical protein BZA70DRAFT_276954 [Myxozyma melibiosi]|uniref:Uncharacterized protein n=1 Tax=Myxozyma melibiosi TaxID=54550 RepID=A0ABR1F7D4_9ASCO
MSFKIPTRGRGSPAPTASSRAGPDRSRSATPSVDSLADAGSENSFEDDAFSIVSGAEFTGDDDFSDDVSNFSVGNFSTSDLQSEQPEADEEEGLSHDPIAGSDVVQDNDFLSASILDKAPLETSSSESTDNTDVLKPLEDTLTDVSTPDTMPTSAPTDSDKKEDLFEISEKPGDCEDEPLSQFSSGSASAASTVLLEIARYVNDMINSLLLFLQGLYTSTGSVKSAKNPSNIVVKAVTTLTVSVMVASYAWTALMEEHEFKFFVHQNDILIRAPKSVLDPSSLLPMYSKVSDFSIQSIKEAYEIDAQSRRFTVENTPLEKTVMVSLNPKDAQGEVNMTIEIYLGSESRYTKQWYLLEFEKTEAPVVAEVNEALSNVKSLAFDYFKFSEQKLAEQAAKLSVAAEISQQKLVGYGAEAKKYSEEVLYPELQREWVKSVHVAREASELSTELAKKAGKETIDFAKRSAPVIREFGNEVKEATAKWTRWLADELRDISKKPTEKASKNAYRGYKKYFT